ncbi:MAG: hypothetical protein ACLFVY_12595 [Phycisphaerae bacterium]
MRYTYVIFLVAVVLAAGHGSGRAADANGADANGCGFALREDKPLARKAKTGEVRGTLRPTDRIARIWATHRPTGKTYQPAGFDANSGAFVFRNLPGASTVDICLETKTGRVIEGIDLSPPDPQLLKLAEKRRRQLGLPAERQHAFTRRDANAVVEWVANAKDFLEQRRVLYVKGHGRRATALVELMRTREFHASDGKLVWRVELWQFVNQFGGWDRIANTEITLRRLRVNPAEWRKVHVEWTPKLSVQIARGGSSKPITFTIPDKASPATSRPANSKPKLDTSPKVLGLDTGGKTVEKPEKPTGTK